MNDHRPGGVEGILTVIPLQLHLPGYALGGILVKVSPVSFHTHHRQGECEFLQTFGNRICGKAVPDQQEIMRTEARCHFFLQSRDAEHPQVLGCMDEYSHGDPDFPCQRTNTPEKIERSAVGFTGTEQVKFDGACRKPHRGGITGIGFVEKLLYGAILARSYPALKHPAEVPFIEVEFPDIA